MTKFKLMTEKEINDHLGFDAIESHKEQLMEDGEIETYPMDEAGMSPRGVQFMMDTFNEIPDKGVSINNPSNLYDEVSFIITSEEGIFYLLSAWFEAEKAFGYYNKDKDELEINS